MYKRQLSRSLGAGVERDLVGRRGPSKERLGELLAPDAEREGRQRDEGRRVVRPLGDAPREVVGVARGAFDRSLGVGVGGLEDVPLLVRPRPAWFSFDAAQAALAVGWRYAVAVGRRA